MANAIPPLMCNTPPPMDGGCFEDDDDDDLSLAGSIEHDDLSPTASHHGQLPIPDAQLPVPDDHEYDALSTDAARQTAVSFTHAVPTDTTLPPPLESHTHTSQIPAPPLDDVRAPAEDVEVVSTHSVYRCDSPPSLDFHDPHSLPDDNVNDNDNVNDADDLPPSSASSLPFAEIMTPDEPARSLHDMLQGIDDRTVEGCEPTMAIADEPPLDDYVPTGATTQIAPAVVLERNDSFDDFATFESAAVGAGTDFNSNTLKVEAPTEDEQQTHFVPVIILAGDDDADADADTGSSNDFGADFSQFGALDSIPAVSHRYDCNFAQATHCTDTGDHADDDDGDDDDDDFGDFADVTTTASTMEKTMMTLTSPAVAFGAPITDSRTVGDDAADDDDFGDFSDFQPMAVAAAPPPPAVESFVIDVQDICARIGPLLGMMFPPVASDSDDVGDNDDDDDDGGDDRVEHAVKLRRIVPIDGHSSDITRTVLNTDEPLALAHQWLTSTGKGELVQALGIDTAKIWNQSMPRFAANLGFTPLEPMKPAVGSAVLQPTPVGAVSVRPTAAVPDVPAAQFDWSGAGLVNPLDGVQEILHEAGHPQNRTSGSDANWPLRPTTAGPQAAATTAAAAASAAAAMASDVPLATDVPSMVARRRSSISGSTTAAASSTSVESHTHPSFAAISNANSCSSAIPSHLSYACAEPAPVSASRIVPGLLGGLKETHIFTPSKARTVSGASMGADDVIVIDENVVTKEYRDVEYNPQPLASSYEAASVTAPTMGTCLQPTRSSVAIEWPEPGRVSGAQLGAFETFDELPTASKGNDAAADDGRPANGGGGGCGDCYTNSIELDQPNPVESFDEFLRGTMTAPAPTDADARPSDDFDDFSDFQYVPLPAKAVAVAQPVRPVAAGELPYGSILQPQPIATAKPDHNNGLLASWPDPGIDPDEMARLEAIFPTPKTSVQEAAQPTSTTSPAKTSLGDSPSRSSTGTSSDEWTDFVSSDAGCQPITHIINQNILKHQQQQQQQQQQQPDEDDWTDFISGGSTIGNAPLKSGNAPNFAAWHAPAAAASVSFGGWSTAIQAPLPPLTTATTFLPTLPAVPMAQQARTSPKHQNGGGHVNANIDAHFATAVKAKPSISLIPDLGNLFGRNGIGGIGGGGGK